MLDIIFYFLLLWSVPVQSGEFTCATAFNHTHTDIREGQIIVSSWIGCSLAGTIDGKPVQLWADSSSCSIKSKIPGTYQIRYDAACGQVLDLTNGSLPPRCEPTPTPTPTPVATPTPTPTPTPQPPSDCVIEAPASTSLPRNGSGSVSVSLNSTPARTITIQAVSDSGQVFVTPSSKTITGTSAVVVFTLRVKKRGAQVTFSAPSSPCLPRTMAVNVR